MQKARPFVLLAGVIALALSLTACVAGTDPGTDGVGQITQAATAANPDVYPLAMGATNIQVGEVRVWNDANFLYVRFVTYAGYELSEAHLCASLAPFAWTPPGQCPYNSGPLPMFLTSWDFIIPLTDLGQVSCGSVIYLQAHAAINAAGTTTQVGSAYGGTFKGRVAYDVTCDQPPEDPGCTLTQGYWKTHPSAWPVPGLTIGGVWYTESQLISLLKTAPRGDASLILGHQLIATLLNQAGGAYAPPEVQTAIDGAQAWMAANPDADGRLPFGIRPTADGVPNPQAWDDAINLAAVLDTYNNGNAGVPHCP